MKTENSLFVIKPYFDNDSQAWVFDDKERGLHKEALVLGADILCEALYEKYGDFSASFSANYIPDSDIVLHRITEPSKERGTWYQEETTHQEAWLCPALFKFFDEAPDSIYLRVNR
jgi:hypothetical protein